MKSKLILAFCLFLAGYAHAADVVFPDINFKQKLLQANTANNIAKDNNGNALQIDADSNGQISTAEALAVYQLNVSGSLIADLTGIESFANLTVLNCSNNQLTTLSVTMLFNLNALDCSNNQLTTLFAKNGSNETIILSGNPTLDYVCADEMQFTALDAQVGASCEVNSYCSLPPGGAYNTISGQIAFVSLSNPIYPFIKVKCTIGTDVFQTMTNAAGQYTFYVQQTSGGYSVSPSLDNTSLFNPVAVASGTLDGTNKVHDFTLTGAPLALLSADVEVAIAPINAAMPGQNAKYQVVYKNKGPNATNVRVKVLFDDVHTNFISSTAPTALITTGQLQLDATALQPFESRSFEMVLGVDAAYPVGSTLDFTTDITVTTIIPGLLDALLGDNTFAYQQTVEPVAPNRTECLQGASVAPSQIGEYLHYMVNFENTGSTPIQDITISNTYDPAYFDISTLQVLYSSHPVDVSSRNSQANYSYRNVAVGGPGGHGGILLKIKTRDDLPQNTPVNNNVDLYFDYEQPIGTQAQMVFGTLSAIDLATDHSIAVYPNPASSVLNIEADSLIRTVDVFDINGRLLQTSLRDGLKATIDIARYNPGIYLLKITTANGIKIQRVIKK